MYLKLHVTPESKRPAVSQSSPDRFRVWVREKAVGNLANKRAIGALAAHLKIDPANIRIISGHRTPHKLIHIRS